MFQKSFVERHIYPIFIIFVIGILLLLVFLIREVCSKDIKPKTQEYDELVNEQK